MQLGDIKNIILAHKLSTRTIVFKLFVTTFCLINDKYLLLEDIRNTVR